MQQASTSGKRRNLQHTKIEAGFSKVQVATGTKLHHHHLRASFMMVHALKQADLAWQRARACQPRRHCILGVSWPTEFRTHWGLCAESSPSSQNLLGRRHAPSCSQRVVTHTSVVRCWMLDRYLTCRLTVPICSPLQLSGTPSKVLMFGWSPLSMASHNDTRSKLTFSAASERHLLEVARL